MAATPLEVIHRLETATDGQSPTYYYLPDLRTWRVGFPGFYLLTMGGTYVAYADGDDPRLAAASFIGRFEPDTAVLLCRHTDEAYRRVWRRGLNWKYTDWTTPRGGSGTTAFNPRPA